MLAAATKAAKVMNEKHKTVMAKRKSRAIKKKSRSKSKKSKGMIGLKALGIY